MWLNVLIFFLLAVHLVTSILLVITVLIQRPKSEGLGAAFGGSVTESLFGAGTTDALTKITIWLVGIFFAITLILAIIFSHKSRWESGDSLEHLIPTPATPAAEADASPDAVPSGSPTEATAETTQPDGEAPTSAEAPTP